MKTNKAMYKTFTINLLHSVVGYCFDMFRPQLLAAFRELTSFLPCNLCGRDSTYTYYNYDYNIIQNLWQVSCTSRKTRKLPEGGQELRPKHVGALINNTVQQDDVQHYVWNTVTWKMYSSNKIVLKLLSLVHKILFGACVLLVT